MKFSKMDLTLHSNILMNNPQNAATQEKTTLFLHLYHEGRPNKQQPLQTPTISSLLLLALGKKDICV
jgi:hypothetical protein